MSFSDTAKQIIAGVAPTLGTALLGPFGTLAGTFIASKLGTAPGDTKAIEAAVTSGSPDVMLKLQQAENDFKAHLADLKLSEDQLLASDTANARSREVSLHDSTPRILAYLVTAGFFGMLYLMYRGKPAEGGDTLLVMLGSLGTAWGLVMSYYFGSSKGSSTKDETISAFVKKS